MALRKGWAWCSSLRRTRRRCGGDCQGVGGSRRIALGLSGLG